MSVCLCVHVQVDVEGCELQVLQGIQHSHWPHIMQVKNHDVCLVQHWSQSVAAKIPLSCLGYSPLAISHYALVHGPRPGQPDSCACKYAFATVVQPTHQAAGMHRCMVTDLDSPTIVLASKQKHAKLCLGVCNVRVEVQMVLEVHDTEGRLRHITHLLQTQQYLVSSTEGLGPGTYLVYARRA